MGFLISKTLYYELRYLAHRFPFHRLLLLFFTVIGATVVSLSDAQSFFTSENSPIPKEWTILKNPNNARIIAIIIIVFPSFFIWISQGYENSKEVEELLKITQDFTLPFLQEDLNNFYNSTCHRFNLSSDCRIYILQPFRKRFLKWHLQIVCHTKNVGQRELEMKLDLDEGAIGYAFQLIKEDSKYKAYYISLANSDDIPAGYRHLSQNNKDRIQPNIKAYLAVPSFQGKFLNALVIINTTNSNDLSHLQNPDLHKCIFDWIGDDPRFLSLLWRLKVNGR